VRRFQVTSLNAPIVMSKQATHHMLDVVRLAPKERFVVFDGNGLECEATLSRVERGLAIIELVSTPTEVSSLRRSHVLVGLPKHASMDRALRMATEIGVTDIHPFVAERSTAKGERMKRWEAITGASTAQCGRSDAVRVHPANSLREHVASLSPETLRFIALPGAKPMPPPTCQNPRAIVIGPEGGLSQTEVTYCLREDFLPVGLADFTLRTDTAVALATSWIAQ